MSRTMLIFVCFFALSACAVARETYLPSGAKGYSIDCSGSAQSWGVCYNKAGDLCGPRGYAVIGGGKENTQMVTANSDMLYAGSMITRTLVIQCGAEEVAE